MRRWAGLTLWATLAAGVCTGGCIVTPRLAAAAKPPPLGEEFPPPPPAPEPSPVVSGVKPPPFGAPEGMRPLPPLPSRPAPGPAVSRPGGMLFASGSGFVVADGVVLTNRHVVRDCRAITARNARNEVVPAALVSSDERRDLALLDVPKAFGPPLVFRNSPAVERGESVVTYGFPLSGVLSSGPSLTTGSVSALSGLQDNPMHFQISAPVQPGNSGGPLLDAQSHVIGVVVAKLDAARVARLTGGDIPQNVNFAIKGSEVLAYLGERGVRVATATSTGPEQRASQTGEVAHPSTVFLQCYK
jgi:S1-C subfamily serine protease